MIVFLWFTKFLYLNKNTFYFTHCNADTLVVTTKSYGKLSIKDRTKLVAI